MGNEEDNGGEFKFSELVDIEELRGLCESFSAITGMATAILDLEGNILVATEWQDLCTRFHRINPLTAGRCHESDTVLAGKLDKGETYNVYKCKNGLVDVAVPIMIDGRHLANFFTGQFFFDKPDREFFLRQAKEAGFDREGYMNALERVPVFSELRIKSAMDYFSRLARLFGEMGLSGKKLEKANKELRKQHEILRTKESDYRSVIDNIQDVFYRSDKSGNLIMVSPSALTLLGYESADELLGKPVADVFYYKPEERAEFLREIREKGRVTNYEVVLKTKSCNPVIVEVSSHIYFDDAGNYAGVEGLFRDITMRKRREKELREASEKRVELEFIINHSPAIAWLWRAVPGWPVEYVSDNLANFGYTPDDFISGRIRYESVIHPDDVQRLAEEIERYTGEGRSEFTQEYRVLTKAGDIRWIDDRTWIRRGVDGTITHYQGIVLDITERKRAEEALRSSEQNLKAIVDGSPIPQFVIDRNHKVTHWNRALEEYSGIRASDVIGTSRQWMAFYDHERPCLVDLLMDGSADSIVQWYEGKFNRSGLIENAYESTDFFPAMKNGKWLRFTAAPVYDNNGKIKSAVETLYDITDEKMGEELLRINAERLDTLLKINQMTDTADYEIMKYAFEEAIRLTQSEIGYLGLMNDDETEIDVQVWSHGVMPECGINDRNLHYQVSTSGLWREAIRQRKAVLNNDDNTPSPLYEESDEERLWIKRHMHVPVISGSKIVLLAGVANKYCEYDETDLRQMTLLMEGMWSIIERNRVYSELRESQRRLKDIIDFLPDATLVIDRNSRVIAWNRAMEDMTGIKGADMIGKGDYEYAVPFYGERRPILIDFVLEQDDNIEKKYTGIRKAGDILFAEAFTPALPGGGAYLSGATSVLRDSSGEIFAAIECIRDNTEHKKAEMERKKLEDQLIQAQKMEAVGRLAGGVAHDFNNMLTPIMGYAELIKKSLSKDDPRLNKLNEIIRASERSRDLVRQLLAFARKQTLEVKPVDLNTLISGFENMLRHTLSENVNIQMNLTPSAFLIMADIGQIEQVILNLAINAQDAMPAGGTLFIITSSEEIDESYARSHEDIKAGSYVVMEIADTGEGIDFETRKRIFEPFFTTKGGRGTGLGLATVYGIIKQHGGHISVYSELNKGTSFRVYIPCYEGTVPASSHAPETEISADGRETLLVVEDQEQVRKMTINLLADCGYTVIEAMDVKTALEIAGSYRKNIQMLITDVVLPDGNGKELYKSLFEKRICSRVLYMSGYPSDIISHHGILETNVHFIQKPFQMAAFIKKVREVLDE